MYVWCHNHGIIWLICMIIYMYLTVYAHKQYLACARTIMQATPLITCQQQLFELTIKEVCNGDVLMHSAWSLNWPDYWQVWSTPCLSLHSRLSDLRAVHSITCQSLAIALWPKAILLCAHSPTNPEPCSADLLSTHAAVPRVHSNWACQDIIHVYPWHFSDRVLAP